MLKTPASQWYSTQWCTHCIHPVLELSKPNCNIMFILRMPSVLTSHTPIIHTPSSLAPQFNLTHSSPPHTSHTHPYSSLSLILYTCLMQTCTIQINSVMERMYLSEWRFTSGRRRGRTESVWCQGDFHLLQRMEIWKVFVVRKIPTVSQLSQLSQLSDAHGLIPNIFFVHIINTNKQSDNLCIR